MQLKNTNYFYLILTLLFTYSKAENKVPDPVSFESTVDDIDKKVTFWLYSRNNRDKPNQMYNAEEKTYESSKYSTERETVFVTHGWLSNNESDAVLTIKNGYLAHADYNIIVVDWSSIAGNKNFGASASRVKAVAQYVSKHVNFLVKKGTKPDDIHLVGHSLGGHVMGLTGYLAEKKVAHVVGLDPAGPGFELQKPDGRISTESGNYVEIIHTCAGILGIKKEVGHVDYFPNGGTVMPGCEVDTTGSCSHARAYYYYEESLKNPNKWYARACDSYDQFILGKCVDGELVDFARWTANGISRTLNKAYYLRTNSEEPYGLGEPGTKPENSTLTEPLTESQEKIREALLSR